MENIKLIEGTKWDHRFMRMAREVQSWSKDPSTKVGCYAVSDRLPITPGYNGLPKQFPDVESLMSDRESKNRLMVHAEKNAIYNAVELGLSLKDSTFYVVGLPVCEECAVALIRSGVKRVVIQDQEVPQRWVESCCRAASYFKIANVSYECLTLNRS